jgi:hypothetical protein
VTSYTQFFSGTATVAGALVGLLFVALSVAPERLRGTHASVEHQAIASTAFTALVDALFVSLIGIASPARAAGAGPGRGVTAVGSRDRWALRYHAQRAPVFPYHPAAPLLAGR